MNMKNQSKDLITVEKDRLNSNLTSNQKIAQQALDRFISNYTEWTYKCQEGTQDDFAGLDYELTRKTEQETHTIPCSFRVRTTKRYNNFMIRKSGAFGSGNNSEYTKISEGTTKSRVYVFYCKESDTLILIETKLIGEYINLNKNQRVLTGPEGGTFVLIDQTKLEELAKEKKMMLKQIPL